LKRFDFTVQRSHLLTMNLESEHNALFDRFHVTLGLVLAVLKTRG